MGMALDIDDVAATSPLAQKELTELRAELSRAEAHLERIRTAFRECRPAEYSHTYEIHAIQWEALEQAINNEAINKGDE